MSKAVLISAGVVALGILLLLGMRDIRRFGTEHSSTSITGTGAGGGSEIGASADSSTEGGDSVATIKFAKNAAPIPQFTIKDIEGHTLSPEDWRGKVVLVNFWATWCPPCRAELPDLIQLQTKYEGKLQIVGLSDDSGPVEDVRTFVRENRMNYPVAIATPELEQKFGGVMGLPTSFLVDTNGRVVQKHIGLRNPALYETEIRALLQMPVQAKVETFEDQGQVFLTNVKQATELPGVDLSKLTPEQKKAALRELNEQTCSCSCGLTLAQCRVNDTSCDISALRAKALVQKIAAVKN
jgi:thiol-disulfide isomerase/thioredoxin